MEGRSITMNFNPEAIARIGYMFGDDISTDEGAENFFNLAIVTLLSIGEELRKGNVIISVPPNKFGKSKGVALNFPKPSQGLKRVK